MIPIIILSIALSLLPYSAQSATGHGQSNKCTFNNSTSCNISLTGVTAGSSIAVAYKTDGPTTLTSASDGTNTYSTPVSLGSDPYMGYTVACNVASGNPTITVTISAANFGGAVAHEITGASAVSCLDTALNNNRQSGVGTNVDDITSNPSGSPMNDGSYIFGFTAKTCCSVPTVTAGTNFTLDQSVNDSGAVAWSEHYVQPTASSLPSTFTQDDAGGPTFHTLVLVIKPTVGGDGGSVNFFGRRSQ